MNQPYDELRFCTSASALVDHWLDLRAPGQLCPLKKDFSPMRMGKTLPDVFLVECVDDDHQIVRVAGSRTSEVTQIDVTGQNMLDVCLPEHRSAIREFYIKMRTGCFAGVTEHALSKTALPSVAKGLQLPLMCDKGNVKYFVGITRAELMEKSQQDFRDRSKNSVVSLNVWFTNLNVQKAPIDQKIG